MSYTSSSNELIRIQTTPCPYCEGRGVVRAPLFIGDTPVILHNTCKLCAGTKVFLVDERGQS